MRTSLRAAHIVLLITSIAGVTTSLDALAAGRHSKKAKAASPARSPEPTSSASAPSVAAPAAAANESAPVSTTTTSSARIEDSAAPPPALEPKRDVVEKDSAASERKRFSVELNPLSLSIGRFSVQGEYLPQPHHALTVNPSFTHTSDLFLGSITGFGAEVGYRYYTSTKGPAGFYVGPSLIIGSYSVSNSAWFDGASRDTSFVSYGAAIDVGGQAVIGPGIVVGGGFGLQYTRTTSDVDTTLLGRSATAAASHSVMPRFLLSVGYAF